jgi:hypothetical protein
MAEDGGTMRDEPSVSELIERSSLGTPEAKRLRARTPRSVTKRALASLNKAATESASSHISKDKSTRRATGRTPHERRKET